MEKAEELRKLGRSEERRVKQEIQIITNEVIEEEK